MARGREQTSALREECRELIERLARENPGWGHFRTRANWKLGGTVSATAGRSVLRRYGVPPAGRRSRLTWKRFLASYAQTPVAGDFSKVIRETERMSRRAAAVHGGIARSRIASMSASGRSRRT